jgi:DNA-binding response OmpR family regulator
MRALVIDDDPDILRITQVCLGRVASWEVLVAESGDEGVALAGRERPDVVLLDLMMPGADDGNYLRQLRDGAATGDIPVIVMTARGAREVAEACLSLGARGVISKPFDPITLHERVASLLSPREPSPGEKEPEPTRHRPPTK